MASRKSVWFALAFLLGTTSSVLPPAYAGPDVCPEPNNEPTAACFLGAAGPAPGFLDTVDDVDLYRVELPPASMLAATLSSLPADYSLRLLMPDGTLNAEAAEPGLSDKVIQVDGLPPGTYFLAVVSQRGEANPDQAYVLSISFPASAAPSAPPAEAASTPAEPPPPACSVPALLPPDVTITPPGPDVPPAVAAFSGFWEGRWGGTGPSRFAVERIDASSATVVYSFTNNPNTPAQWVRRPAQVEAGPKLLWRYADQPNAGVLTFTMAADLKSIGGSLQFGSNVTATVTMTRCSQG